MRNALRRVGIDSDRAGTGGCEATLKLMKAKVSLRLWRLVTWPIQVRVQVVGPQEGYVANANINIRWK